MSPRYFAALVLVGALAACGPQAARDAGQPTAACGSPSKLRFHGVHAVRMATPEVTPQEAATVADGCAIVSFGLDAAGKMTAPELELERPAGVGIGAVAIALLARNTYAPNGENLFGNQRPDEPSARFAATVGFAHEDGRLVIAFRTPFAFHPSPADRPFPRDE